MNPGNDIGALKKVEVLVPRPSRARARLLCSMIVGLLCSTAALAQGDLAWGIRLLEKGQLNSSLDVFNDLARQDPANAEIHYWRGQALQGLGRATEATKEYKLAIALGLPKKLEAACKSKLGDADVQSTEQAAAQPDVPTRPAIDPPQIKATIKNILRQTEGRMKDSISDGNRSYRNREYSNPMAQWPAPPPFPGLRNQGPLARAAGRSAPDPYKQAAQSRAVAFHEAALGLESQLTNKPHKWSGVYLDPTGTNLYVRNYSHFTPEQPEPLVPLQAEAYLMDSLKNKPAASKQGNAQKR